MKHYLPQISWHDREPIMSLDFQKCPDPDWPVNRYKMVTASMSKEIRIWHCGFETDDTETKSGMLDVHFIANLIGHYSAINVVRFSLKDGLLASGDSDSLICLWSVNPSSAPDIFANDDLPPNKENWQVIKRLRTHHGDVCDLCWSADGSKLASVSLDKSLIIHDTTTGGDANEGCSSISIYLSGHHLRILKDYSQFPNGVCWDPRNEFVLTLGTDRRMHVFDAKSSKFPRVVRLLKTQLPEIPGLVPASTYNLFADDQLMTFIRRPDFSPDGRLLIVPSGMLEVGKESLSMSYIFDRADFEKPIAIIRTPSPTSTARCCPVLFTLREQAESKPLLKLDYRVVFALLTNDSVVLYDSQHELPIALIDNIHYSTLTDLAWSSDGRLLMVTSTDGYCSFVLFDINQLGCPCSISSAFQTVISPKVTPAKTLKRSRSSGQKRPATVLAPVSTMDCFLAKNGVTSPGTADANHSLPAQISSYSTSIFCHFSVSKDPVIVKTPRRIQIITLNDQSDPPSRISNHI